MILIRVLCGIFSCFAAVFVNYYIAAEVESRLNIYSTSAQILLLIAQLAFIYVLSQRILFKKLTRAEIVLLSAAYGISVISVLFLRFPAMNMLENFGIRSYFMNWPVCWNPFSFLFDAAADRFSIFVSLLNVLLFIPLKPILAATKLRPKWWMIIAGFASVELLQYVLHAGFFDLGDIVLYFIGYLAGAGILKIYLDKECRAHLFELSGASDK